MMSDAALGLTMLSLIIVVIMLGFPTAFTLMGLGMVFGFVAFYDPAAPWFDNRIFAALLALFAPPVGRSRHVVRDVLNGRR